MFTLDFLNIYYYKIMDKIINDDYEFIINIKERGPNFLEQCYDYYYGLNDDKHDKDNYYEKINSYHSLFLSNTEIFEGSIDLYIDYMYKNSRLWKELILFEDNENIKNLISIFLQKIKKMDIEKKILICTKIFDNDKIRFFLEQKLFWFDTYDDVEESFMGDIISSIKVDDDWDKWINFICNLIVLLFKNKKVKSLFVEWVAIMVNKNISRMNFSVNPSEKINNKIDNFLINIMGIVYVLWKNGINGKRLKNIRPDYIINENCPISWYDKNKLIKPKKYNFITQCFFLFLNCLRVVYIPICENIKNWKNYLSGLKDVKNLLEVEGSLPAQVRLFKVYKEIKDVTDTINISVRIKNNNILKKWINHFYYDLIRWIKLYWNNSIALDDILYNMAKYIIWSHGSKNQIKFNMSKDLTSLSLDIIGSRKYVSNPDIRFKYFVIIKKIILNGTIILIKEFFSGILELHNDLENYDSMQYNKIIKRLPMYSFLNQFIIEFMKSDDDNYIGLINDILACDKNKTKTFINIVLNDINYLNSIMDSCETKLNTLTDKTSNAYIGEAKFLYESLSYYAEMIKFHRHMCFVESFKLSQTSPELLSILAIVVGKTLKRLIETHKLRLLYLEELDEGEDLDLIDIIKCIIGICVTIEDITNFSQYVVNDSISFNINYLYECTNYCANPLEKECFVKFTKNCENFVSNTEEKNAIEYPDQFLDPITFNVIKDPVLLPGMIGWDDMFFDKSGIMKHILNKKENPYTRKPLTIEEFEEFNLKEDNIKKITEFKKKMCEFLDNKVKNLE